MKRELIEDPIIFLISSLLLFWTLPLLPFYYNDAVSKFLLDTFPALAALESFNLNFQEMSRSSENPSIGNYAVFAISGILSAVMLGRLFGVS